MRLSRLVNMESEREPEIWFSRSFHRSPEIRELLELSTKDPYLGDMAMRRGANSALMLFQADNEVVGFAMPRKDSDGHYRTGPIFVKPEWRQKGIAKKWTEGFFAHRKGRAYIEEGNVASQKLYESLGFKKTEKFVTDGTVKLYQYLKAA